VNGPDLHAPSLRVLECTACGEPVWAEPSGNEITLHCGYCGFDDVRALASFVVPGVSPGDVYRGERGSRVSRKVIADLTKPPEGISVRPKPDDLRGALKDARKRIAELDDSEERIAHEHRVVYCAAVLSNILWRKHDALRARAVLESALETVREPIHRALLLARLARLAAFDDSTDLAERWLTGVPDLRVAEVSTDVRVARAAIARARGDAKGVLDVLGAESASVGVSRHLAMALRADAHECLGDLREARRVYRRGSRGAQFAFGAVLNTFELAPRARKRTILVGVLAISVLASALFALALAIQGSLLAAVGVMVFALISAVFVKML
jgi:hypothetical protein